jgi:hypothetical protein
MQQIGLSDGLSRPQRAALNRSGIKSPTREGTILWEHPMFSPPTLAEGEPYMLRSQTPDPWSPEAAWKAFREEMSALAQANPSHNFPRAYLDWTDRTLAWRAALPEHLQFWDLD